MPLGMLFWLIMLLWLFFGLWWNWPADSTNRLGFAGLGGHLLVFVLFFILGWRVFGFVVQ